MEPVVRLAEIDPAAGLGLGAVGGKAANLGVLLRAGFPVPTGFCVTTAAYREVVGGRLDEVVARLADTAADDQEGGRRLAERARRLIADAPLPDALRSQIRGAYEQLRPGAAVAVRSSATAEDLAFASFAGQQDTYLNVVGTEALIDAVRACWASLWTDRAVSYRLANGIDQTSVTLAVVVQEMVDVVAAGVMFTANPVTGTRRQAVIDASPGLGEAVVSGAVNPDHFVIDTLTGLVKERRLGDKRVLIRSLAGGGTERVDLDSSVEHACLTDSQLRDLAALGRRVEDHYGSPQDTEWAIDFAGTCWLTQARPITTLYPLITRPEQPGRRVFLCLSLAQGLTRPITPLGQSAFRLIGTSVLAAIGRPAADPLGGPPAMRMEGMRVYMDVTAALRNPIGRRIVLAVFGIMEARAAAVLRDLAARPEFSLKAASPLVVIRPVARALWRVKAPLGLVRGILSPALAYRDTARTEQWLRAQLASDGDPSPAQRLDRMQELLSTQVFLLMPKTIVYAAGGFMMLALASRLLRGIAQPGELQAILRGLPHNITTEMDLALWDLTQDIRGDRDSGQVFASSATAELTRAFGQGSLPARAQQGLARFLQRYGHRAIAEIDLGLPRWSDDPTHLLGMIKNYLQLEDAELAPSVQFAAAARQAVATVASLTERARSRGAVRGRVVGFALGRARELAGLRETPKFLLVLALAAMRKELQQVGTALAQAGRIDAADDVFFLEVTEVRRGLAGESMHGLVAERRAAYDQELRRRHIPRLVLSDGTEPETLLVRAEAPEGALVGSPASAGTVTGIARVVLDPVGARLEPGEILVAPSTDPGWTPLFLTAGGLVMEMGGSNSHGAVVAREYGIPAVVGVPDATHAITSGQRITVDGAAGLVTLAS